MRQNIKIQLKYLSSTKLETWKLDMKNTKLWIIDLHMNVTCQMHSKKVLNNRPTHECHMLNALQNSFE